MTGGRKQPDKWTKEGASTTEGKIEQGGKVS